MEKSNKRGKIPQQDWPSIIARYEAGETLASIARTYDCSPPAISYIVSRSRARNLTAPASTATAPETAPQAQASRLFEEPRQTAPAAESQPAKHAPNDVVAPQGESPPRTDAGSIQPAPAAAVTRDTGQGASELRRTLHLSHGHGNGAEARPNSGLTATGETANGRAAAPIAHHPAGPQHAHHNTQSARPPISGGGTGASVHVMPEPPRQRETGAIDSALRERVSDDIAAFLAAFDAALAGDTIESRTSLREATDRLLRAGARTRIELERLEARFPLPPRERAEAMPAGWRSR